MNNENKKSISNFFGVFQYVRQTYVSYTREKFDIKEDWFERIFNKHYTAEFNAKYNPELYVEQGVAKEILNFILPEQKFKDLLNELRILEDWLNDFIAEYEVLIIMLNAEGIKVNDKSKLHLQFELIKQRSKELLEIKNHNDEHLISFEKKIIPKLLLFNLEGIVVPPHYQNRGGEGYYR